MQTDLTIEDHIDDVSKKFLRFGWSFIFSVSNEKSSIYSYRHINTKKFAKIFYVKEKYRKTGQFKEFNKTDPLYITLPECNLQKVFDKFGCQYKMLVDGCEDAYALIEKEYEGKFSKRGKIPYINHIYQGLGILYLLDADLATKKAFCYHPIYQNGSNITSNDNWSLILASDYAEIANRFLRTSEEYLNSNHHTVEILKYELEYQPEVKNMLIADKIQNYYSFNRHKTFFNERFEIREYFMWWFDVLEISHVFLDKCLNYIENT